MLHGHVAPTMGVTVSALLAGAARPRRGANVARAHPRMHGSGAGRRDLTADRVRGSVLRWKVPGLPALSRRALARLPVHMNRIPVGFLLQLVGGQNAG